MKGYGFVKRLTTVKRWISTALFGLLAVAFIWQGAFLSSSMAMPASDVSLLAFTSDHQVQDKVRNDADRTKGFVENAKEAVQDAAKSNADRIERATDGSNPIERRANRDAGRIQERAERHADRTQDAIDDTQNVFERAVDGIKDAFSS